MPDLDLDALLDDPRAGVGRQPIPGDEPSGRDLRGEASFDELDNEVRKMESDGPKAVDWKLVNRKTLEILAGQSKDLVLACRLVYGLHVAEGYKGLAVGASILAGMAQDHWNGLFPGLNRERARAGSLDWMAERLAQVVEGQPPASADAKLFALVAHERLVELDNAVSQRMTKFQPALGPLIRALRPFARETRAELEAKAAAEAAAKEPPPVADVKAQDATASPPQPAVEQASPSAANTAVSTPPQPVPAADRAVPAAPLPALGAIPVAEGVDAAFDALFSAALRVSGALREGASQDARVYLASRFGAWSNLRQAPPERAGKTLIPPPQRTKLAELQALTAAGNHLGLLMAAESAFITSPFWLTMQFTINRMMLQLGAPYDGCRQVVSQSLALLLERIPSLTELSFSDGTPFADADTRAWIASEVLVSRSSAQPGGELEDGLAQAERLAQDGKVLDGLKHLADLADQAADGRRRFQAKLTLVSYCLRHDLVQPGAAQIAALERIAEEWRLAAWEPALVSRLLVLSWQCHDHKNAVRLFGEAGVVQAKAKIAERLGSIDVVQAARLVLS